MGHPNFKLPSSEDGTSWETSDLPADNPRSDALLTSAKSEAVRFHTARGRKGYAHREVEQYVSQVTESLAWLESALAAKDTAAQEQASEITELRERVFSSTSFEDGLIAFPTALRLALPKA